MVSAMLGFAVVAGLLTLTPGIDTALVLRTAANYRRAAAFAVAVGICCGCLVWGIAAAVGVSALLAASTAAFTVLRLVGAGYMVFLGARMLVHAFHSPPTSADAGQQVSPGKGADVGRFWRQGFLVNLLNPKVGAFYVALLPQFIPADQPPALAGAVLAFIHAAESLAWFTALILLVHRAAAWLQRPKVRRGIDTVTGLTVIGFGVKLASTRM